MSVSQFKNGKPGLRESEASKLFSLAVEAHRHGSLEEAVRGYVRALALDPKAADIYNNLGVA
ncbi:MAG TPA: tetratricopeptide repeat protein, partial [Rhodospirillales bacterium]|nr:tetratricopeptide repeat protein [Rhodospirillales bacterium]